MGIPTQEGYQLRHQDFGIFQGMALGISFWYPLSQVPTLGLKSYPTACDAYAAIRQICAEILGPPISPNDVIVEPHELARSVFLRCRICAVHSIVGAEATTRIQGQTLANVVEPELLAQRPFILDFAELSTITDTFLDGFLQELSVKPDVTAEELGRLVTVAHLAPFLHERLALLTAQAFTPSSSNSTQPPMWFHSTE